jgi:CheY-like chemotaxis protein
VIETTILLVEPDPASQRVMEVSLKKVGYGVQSAVTLGEALRFAQELHPQMILCDAQLPDGTGYDLCRHIRTDAQLSRSGVVIMSDDARPQARIDAITAGADEFMRKPVRIKEIVNRTTALLDRQAYDTLAELDGTRNFSGTLEDIGLVDLLQLIETGKKNCIIHLASDPKQSGGLAETSESGRIYCRDGRVIDAELKQRSGAYAVYRMMLWDNGAFEMEFTPLGRESIIHLEPQELVMEGMKQVDRWTKIRDSLPSLSIRLDVDYTALSKRVEQLPEEVESLIRLFDGRRSTRDVLNESNILDIPALEAIGRLFAEEILFDKRARPVLPPASGVSVSLNAWLSSAPAPRRSSIGTSRPSTSIPGLPSVLGRAMIPAQESPSEILRPMTIDTAYPQPIANAHLDDEPILLTDASRKHSTPSPLNRPLSHRASSVPRPRTLTAPVPMAAVDIQAPPPPPVRSMTPPQFASIAQDEAVTQAMPSVPVPMPAPMPAPIPRAATPADPAFDAIPPSDEFASPRQLNPAAAVLNQTVSKTTPEANTGLITPNAEPSVAHQKEDTAERFFRIYDEDRVAEAAGVGHRGTQIALAVAVLVVAGLFGVLLDQKSATPTGKSVPAWPKAGDGMTIESLPLAKTPATAVTKPETPTPESTGQSAAAVPPVTDESSPAPAQTTPPAAATEKPNQAQISSPEPVKAEPVKAEPVKAEPVKAEPVKAEPVKAEPVKRAKPVKAKPVKGAKQKKTLPRKASKSRNDPEVVDRLNQAESALASKDLSAASAAFKKVISLNKSNVKAHSGLALTLVSQGKSKSAISSARRALKLSRYKNARAYMALGLGYGELEKDKKAIKALSRFLKLAPNHARASEIESYIEALEEED